jgi:hypothetical protein
VADRQADWASAEQPSPSEQAAHSAATGRAHGVVTMCSPRARWRGGTLASGSVVAGQRHGAPGEVGGGGESAPERWVDVRWWSGGGATVLRGGGGGSQWSAMMRP